MILVIDNYDSFVFNLARYFEILGHKTLIKRNDAISLNMIEAIGPTHIIISPGPKAPENAGLCLDIIKYFNGKVPILGVCLGMQAIAQAAGANIIQHHNPIHGKSTLLKHNRHSIFQGLPPKFKVGRYHSLMVDEKSLSKSPNIEILAKSNNIIMAIKDKINPTIGLQFHPESVLTEFGIEILQNFLKIT